MKRPEKKKLIDVDDVAKINANKACQINTERMIYNKAIEDYEAFLPDLEELYEKIRETELVSDDIAGEIASAISKRLKGG